MDPLLFAFRNEVTFLLSHTGLLCDNEYNIKTESYRNGQVMVLVCSVRDMCCCFCCCCCCAVFVYVYEIG